LEIGSLKSVSENGIIRVILIPVMTGVLIDKGKIWTQRQTCTEEKEQSCDDTGRDWGNVYINCE
jgi:hypothetical protein